MVKAGIENENVLTVQVDNTHIFGHFSKPSSVRFHGPVLRSLTTEMVSTNSKDGVFVLLAVFNLPNLLFLGTDVATLVVGDQIFAKWVDGTEDGTNILLSWSVEALVDVSIIAGNRLLTS